MSSSLRRRRPFCRRRPRLCHRRRRRRRRRRLLCLRRRRRRLCHRRSFVRLFVCSFDIIVRSTDSAFVVCSFVGEPEVVVVLLVVG